MVMEVGAQEFAGAQNHKSWVLYGERGCSTFAEELEYVGKDAVVLILKE